MKTTRFLTLAASIKPAFFAIALAFSAITMPAHAQTAGSGGNPFLDEPQGNDQDFIKAITKQPYIFLSPTEQIIFHSDGTGEEQGKKFKWHVRDAHSVDFFELGSNGRPDGKKGKLTFSDDYSSFTGTFDFLGVGGRRVQN